MRRFLFILIATLTALSGHATTYYGRVVDDARRPVPFATVYPLDSVLLGTATNDNGYFTFDANLPESGLVMISFVGYDRKTVPLHQLRGDTMTIVLHEKPIALDETTVSAKYKKLKGKKKEMAQLLYKVYQQLLSETPEQCVRYHVVSETRITDGDNKYTTEQLVSTMTTIPEGAKSGTDSVQLQAKHCKRFVPAVVQKRTEDLLSSKKLDPKARKYIAAADSGVAAYRMLFTMGNVRYDLEQTISDLNHWKIASESPNELILSHTEGKNYIGIFKWTKTRNYVVNPKTYALIRFSEHLSMDINIPFGHKLKEQELAIFNLLSMSDKQYDKFRVRKGHVDCTLQTTYRRRDGKLYIQEKVLKSDGLLTGSKGVTIPTHVKASQRVTAVETQGVKPLKRSQITYRFPRQIIEIQ